MRDPEPSIEESFDRLAELLEEGTITEAVFAVVVRKESDLTGAPIGARAAFASWFRAALLHPQMIGWNAEALHGGCSCDDGWVEENGGMRPCDRCRGAAYRWWYDHERIRDHTCATCEGHKARRRRGRADPRGGRDADEARAEQDRRIREDLA